MKHRVFDRLLERFSPIAHFEVAEHSFQVPMSNSSLLLNYLCFCAHFLQESRLITEVLFYSCILANVCHDNGAG